MSNNHPNRGKVRTSASKPLPDAIRAARDATGLTHAQAGAVIHGSERSWQDYEAGVRGMHPGLFELFVLKTGHLKR